MCRTFQIYKQIVQPFWGLLVDIEDFESKLCVYLEDRSASSKHPANGGKGVSSAWLGMLFAVLAVATNYSEHSYHKRVAISQNFGTFNEDPRSSSTNLLVHCSFHCLRLSNYLIRPSLESLQALIILGFVLSNDMKAEASWALMGLTCRLAQALGLHRAPNEGAQHAPIPAGSDLPRRKLWYARSRSMSRLSNTPQVDHSLARQPSITLLRPITHRHHDPMPITPQTNCSNRRLLIHGSNVYIMLQYPPIGQERLKLLPNLRPNHGQFRRSREHSAASRPSSSFHGPMQNSTRSSSALRCQTPYLVRRIGVLSSRASPRRESRNGRYAESHSGRQVQSKPHRDSTHVPKDALTKCNPDSLLGIYIPRSLLRRSPRHSRRNKNRSRSAATAREPDLGFVSDSGERTDIS